MPWVGRFQKDKNRDTASNIGTAYADWYVDTELICTYSQRVDGVNDKTEFKANAEAYRDKFIADKAKNEQLESALTTYLNQ